MALSRFAVSTIPIGLMVLGIGVASGQDFPSKPVRIITGGAGGSNDFAARQIAQGISGPLGQPVIVDNQAGTTAPILVSKAPPDGYALLVAGSNTWVSPFFQKVPFDVVKDFSPITLLVRNVNVVAVHPSLPARSITELIALTKARPGQLNFGASTTGSSNHLAAELFKAMAGIDIVRVPYKASPAVIIGLMSGEVQMSVIDVGLVMPHVSSNRLRALAVTSAQPSALAPGLPTVAASGLPGYEATSVFGIFAPAKTPAAVINRLNHEIVLLLNRADVKEQFLNAGIELVTSSPEQFEATIKSEMAKTGKLLKDAGIKPE